MSCMSLVMLSSVLIAKYCPLCLSLAMPCLSHFPSPIPAPTQHSTMVVKGCACLLTNFLPNFQLHHWLEVYWRGVNRLQLVKR